ncbi:hypothetical protein FISHEDRAFT_68683 [Fistulina hepatica ATCC 64428]|uniref:Uncharacterized protein n=1 Tax=Fistulina hepatica ATCC 64428 TaxID=1128425 RepID=A0A0D7AS58_9AGAR|nr:hypothetical protein FISHEDRAFT_68683 [Fistulina hepatica ATCC 64428]
MTASKTDDIFSHFITPTAINYNGLNEPCTFYGQAVPLSPESKIEPIDDPSTPLIDDRQASGDCGNQHVIQTSTNSVGYHSTAGLSSLLPPLPPPSPLSFDSFDFFVNELGFDDSPRPQLDDATTRDFEDDNDVEDAYRVERADDTPSPTAQSDEDHQAAEDCRPSPQSNASRALQHEAAKARSPVKPFKTNKLVSLWEIRPKDPALSLATHQADYRPMEDRGRGPSLDGVCAMLHEASKTHVHWTHTRPRHLARAPGVKKHIDLCQVISTRPRPRIIIQRRSRNLR